MPAYRFGPYSLDPARRELLLEGAPVALPPKVFDLIVYLLEHRERAVGRDELIAGVWGRVDVSDNVLDQIVLRARRALGDTGEPRHSIATRPRFGFAWVRAVEMVEDDPAPQHDDTAASTGVAGDQAPASPRAADAPGTAAMAVEAAPSRSRPALAMAVATLAAALAIAVVVAAWPWPRTGADGQDIGAAAAAAPAATLVVPFDIDPQANADWARLGLMDLVADRLREAGIETVPSDNAVALLRGAAPHGGEEHALHDLAQRAGAARTVHGRVAVRAGRWQVALRLRGSERMALEATAEAREPLAAARMAADQLVVALGHMPAGVALPGDAALALRLQQIDAAVLGDAIDVAQRLLAEVPAAQRDEPEVRLRAATLRFRRGELDEAATQFEALLADVSPSDAPHLHGTVLSALGNLALRRGDPAEAERRGDEAIAVLSTLPPSSELGRAWTGRAIARSTQGDYAAALEDFAHARVVLDSIGDRLGAARVDINAGILDARRDRHAEAEPVLAAAADRLTAFNDLTNELYARVALAQVRLALLDPSAALAGDARLADVVAREPNAERRRYANLTRAEVLAANGRLREADALLAAVRASASEDGDIVLLGVARALAAHWSLPRDPATAAREAQAALNAPWEDEGPRRYAATWRVLVRSRLALEDLEAARAALAGFEAWAARRGEGSIDASLWLARAELAAAQGDTADAADAYERALAAAEAARVPAELLQVGASYAPWLIAQGQAARGAAVAGRSAAWAERDYDAALAAARLHRALGHASGWQAALSQARRLAGERVLPADIVDAAP